MFYLNLELEYFLGSYVVNNKPQYDTNFFVEKIRTGESSFLGSDNFQFETKA